MKISGKTFFTVFLAAASVAVLYDVVTGGPISEKIGVKKV